MATTQIGISVELYEHFKAAKPAGQSFDEYLRALAGLQPKPARSAKPKGHGGFVGRPPSPDHLKLLALEVGQSCLLAFSLVEPVRDAAGGIIRMDPPSNARALQSLVRRVEMATGRTFFSQGQYRDLKVLRVA